ncbi:MAG: type II secretion system F family protein [Phycisphaerae bacterium]|nr:type II secretion system F family protein [Phycisphaerae bacterium]
MALYAYQAVTTDGRMMTGELESASQEQVKLLLEEMNLSVHSVQKCKTHTPRSRMGKSEFILFNQQLASITKAGIPLEQGLKELARDVESRHVRSLIEELLADLEQGTSLEDAFEKRRGFFPPLYGQIIQAGVQSGRLGEMLASLNRHIEISRQTRRMVIEAVTYPTFVLFFAAGILTAFLHWIVPSFHVIFSDLGECLPGPTHMILYLGDHVLDFWIGVGVIVGGFVLLGILLNNSPGGRRLKEGIYFRLPILGRLLHRSKLSRLADAMALLIGAGCDMPTCLRLASGATGSETMKQQCEWIAESVEQGEPIVEAAALCPAIPPFFAYSIQLGAQRNELEDNLYSLADMYTQQTQTNQARLQSLLMPTLVVILGAFIGFAIVALFMPMVSMLCAVQG